MNLSQALTPAQHRLIRINLALIPVYGWLLLVWTTYAVDISPAGHLDRSGHIKGHDFAHFYVLGEIANDKAAGDLYNFAAQAERMDQLVPEYEHRFPPIHSPQVSLLFAPLARMPYEVALRVWLAITCTGYAICCVLLWTQSQSRRRDGWVVVILAAGYPPLYQLVAFGQSSVLALICVTAAYFALRARRPWLAGLALGSLIYKPSLGVALPFILLYGREWRMLMGASVAALLQFSAAAAYYGSGVLARYLDTVTHVGQVAGLMEPMRDQMQSLRSFFLILVPWPDVAFAAYVLAAVAVIALAAVCWRTSATLELRYSVLLLAMMLVDPHVYPYDLVTIIPMFFLIVRWAAGRGGPSRSLWTLLFFCYYLPGLSFVATLTHIQVSVVAIAALMMVLARAAHIRNPVVTSVPA